MFNGDILFSEISMTELRKMFSPYQEIWGRGQLEVLFCEEPG